MSSNFNMSFDPSVKQQFAQLTANYGLTVAQAFKLFANQAIKTGVLPLSFDWQKPIDAPELGADDLNPKTKKAIAQGRADYKAGKLDKIHPDEAMKALLDIARG